MGMKDLKRPSDIWIDNEYNELVLRKLSKNASHVVRIKISEENNKELMEIFGR